MLIESMNNVIMTIIIDSKNNNEKENKRFSFMEKNKNEKEITSPPLPCFFFPIKATTP